jgi:hypothetical protein
MFTKRRTGAKGKLRPHAYEGEGEGGLFDDRRTEEKQVAATTAHT